MYGQVFVVTRGAANVRLGELKVFLFKRLDFDAFKLPARAAAEFAALRQAWEEGKHLGTEREELVTQIKATYSTLLNQRQELIERLAAAQLVHEKWNVLKNQISERDKALTEFRRELANMPASSYRECEEVRRAIEALPSRLFAVVYDHFAPRSAVCKTDADGHFRFECDSGQRYVVFTRGQRQIVNQVERYEWLVEASPSPNEKRVLLLTNDNTTSGSGPENLMRDTTLPDLEALEPIPSSQSRLLAEPKRVRAEPRWAPEGQQFVLSYRSITTPHGITGIPPGTVVKEIGRLGDTCRVEFNGVKFEVPSSELTDNVDVAERLRRADVSMQAEISGWQMAEQEAERQNRAVENRLYDEAQRVIQENYKRLHTLTGESRLNEPPRP